MVFVFVFSDKVTLQKFTYWWVFSCCTVLCKRMAKAKAANIRMAKAADIRMAKAGNISQHTA